MFVLSDKSSALTPFKAMARMLIRNPLAMATLADQDGTDARQLFGICGGANPFTYCDDTTFVHLVKEVEMKSNA